MWFWLRGGSLLVELLLTQISAASHCRWPYLKLIRFKGTASLDTHTHTLTHKHVRKERENERPPETKRASHRVKTDREMVRWDR